MNQVHSLPVMPKNKLIAFLLLLAVLLPLPAMANSEEKKEEEATGPQFVPIGPITVPIIRQGKIYQYVRIQVQLETKDGEGAKIVTDRKPSLNDAYLSSLYGAFYVGDGLDGPLVDIEKIKSRLAAANAKVLPADTVQNILIQQVSQTTR